MRILAFVTALLLSPAVMADGLTDLSDAERNALHNEIRAYLLENPEILLEVTEVLEQRQADQQAATDAELIAENSDALFNDGYSFVAGNPEGDLTIVEFLDYQCGYCKRAHPDVQALLNEDPNIRLVVKEFPILGPTSMTASRAAIGVLQDQGPEAYKAFSDALMENEGQLNDAVIVRLAEEAGVDITTIDASASKDEVAEVVLANRELASELGLTGTPTFVIGKTILRGYAPLEEMRRIVAKARADG